MKLSWESHGDVALLIASGDFSADAADHFRRVAGERFAAGARSCVLDVANVTLADSAALESMLVLRRGNRLSVTPVSAEDWRFVLSLA
jgi:anti-anti-sigma regulatory factor